MAGSLALRLGLASADPAAVLTLLPARCDLLLAGVGLALLHRRVDLKAYLPFLRIGSLACACSMLGLVLIAPSWMVTWGQSFLALGIACFLGAIINGAPEGRRYAGPLLRWFGQISLALYLVHQPISGLLHGLILNGRPDVQTPAQIAVSLLAAALSIAAAACSWSWLEAPILNWAHGFRFESPQRAPDGDGLPARRALRSQAAR
jgi:peptidoglycan/LPS O-acetylase OafA/YrhL